MAAPNAPTSVTLTQTTSGQGYGGLAWSHDQTGLDRFEVLYQETNVTTWTSWALASKTTFGAAGTYSTTVPIKNGITWAVRAFNTGNEASSAGTDTFAGTVEGCWLLPYLAGVYQSSRHIYTNAQASPFAKPRPYTVFDPDSRDHKVVQLGRPKGVEGSITGDLIGKFSLTSDQWRSRLDYLMDNQEDYHIALVTPHLLLSSVTLLETPMDPWLHPDPNYGVSLLYVEVD